MIRPGEIELCVTVDDLPVHGAPHPQLSRRDIACLFLEAFRRHGVTGACGFVNGAYTQSLFKTRLLRWTVKHETGRKLVDMLCDRNLSGPSSYFNADLPDPSPSHLAILTDWTAAGHVLANHTYWHSNLNRVGPQLFIKGIEENERLLRNLGGKKLFRYPYFAEGKSADDRELVKQYLQSHGYSVPPGTVSFKDWAWNNVFMDRLHTRSDRDAKLLQQKYVDIGALALTNSVFTARRLFGHDIKHVLVLHVGYFTGLTLERLLSRYAEMGVRFISVDELVADDQYEKFVETVRHPAWQQDVRMEIIRQARQISAGSECV